MIIKLPLFLCLIVQCLNNDVKNEINFEKLITKTSQIQGRVQDIKWCGNGLNILILTDFGHLYRSEDRGQTWFNLKNILQKLGKQQIDEDFSEVGEVSQMVVSKVDQEVVMFIGTHDISWRTENCGKSIVAMNLGRPVEEIQLHPVRRDWLLAAAWSKCKDFDNQEDCEIYKEVYVSLDLGDSWKTLEKFIINFRWAKQTKESIVPDERIIIAHETFGKGHQSINGWSDKIHIYQSDNFFNTKKMIVPQGNTFLITNDYFFAVKVIHEGQQDLLVAKTDSKDYEFKPIDIPVKHLKQHSYSVLDTSENQVFIHVNHYSGNAKYGNLYISDVSGLNYAGSLTHNVRENSGNCDFEKLQSLKGVYLANIYDEKQVQKTKGSQAGIQGSVDMNQQQRDQAEKQFKLLSNYKQTRISFNKGGSWQAITPPELDIDGIIINCPSKDCQLHLNSHSSYQFGPFYSTKNSIGIIIGTGNVGQYLSLSPQHQNTYISRNAGQSWTQIAKGSHIYEIGDHGAILVMATNQQATNIIKYSFDEGLTWHEITLNDYYEIQNIITEPSNTGSHFIAYGVDEKLEGIMISLDFSQMFNRTCQGNPYDSDSDFEFWSPNDIVLDFPCILGKSTTYVRRKQKAQCFNGENLEKIVQERNCSCTEYDWECDTGYYRNYVDGQCYSKTRFKFQIPKVCQGYYNMSQGKVSGSTCEGGIDRGHLQISCSSSLFENKAFYFLLIGVVILIMVNIGNLQDFYYAKFGNSINPMQKYQYIRKDGYIQQKSMDQIEDNSLNDDSEEYQYYQKQV